LLGVVQVRLTAPEPVVLVTVKVLELFEVAVMTNASAAVEVMTTVLGSLASRIGAGPVLPVQVHLA
jgi:hypothetical protein